MSFNEQSNSKVAGQVSRKQKTNHKGKEARYAKATTMNFSIKIAKRTSSTISLHNVSFRERLLDSTSVSRYFSNKPPLARSQRNSSNTGTIPTYIWIGVGVPVVASAYFYYHFLDTAPLTHRKRWIATSPEWERQLGDSEHKKLLDQFRGKTLPKDHRASITVNRVGSRIAKAAQTFCDEHNIPNFKATNPTFTVVRSDMANAFVLPNNHVFVMTGLFQFAQNEDELAAVLGHEYAHNIARHVGEKVSGSLVVGMLARLSLLLDPSGVLLTIFLPASSLLRELPHSRIQESEADQIGIHLAALACYDPRAAKRVFQNMKDSTTAGGGRSNPSPPEFLSTHPNHETRIVNFDQWLPAAMSIYSSDGGDRCRRIRQEMVAARQVAALRAANRENVVGAARPSR